LERRLAKLEHAMMAGKIADDQQDPELVSFMAYFGVSVEECPRGVSAKDWLTEAFKGARILVPRSN
jgi:hypothetical protein